MTYHKLFLHFLGLLDFTSSLLNSFFSFLETRTDLPIQFFSLLLSLILLPNRFPQSSFIIRFIKSFFCILFSFPALFSHGGSKFKYQKFIFTLFTFESGFFYVDYLNFELFFCSMGTLQLRPSEMVMTGRNNMA